MSTAKCRKCGGDGMLWVRTLAVSATGNIETELAEDGTRLCDLPYGLRQRLASQKVCPRCSASGQLSEALQLDHERHGRYC